MDIVKCDVCKKTNEELNLERNEFNRLSLDNCYVNFKVHHICPDCKNRLRELLDGDKVIKFITLRNSQPDPVKEIDWDKVPIDTKLYVWSSYGSIENAIPRYYAGGIGDIGIMVYDGGKTSWSHDKNSVNIYKHEWENWELAEEPKEEWYK